MTTSSKVKLSTDHVLKGLDDLRNQELLCDVHLVAEGAKFPAHRVVLAAASSYFQAMFTGGFKENKMGEITLNDMSGKGLKDVLNAIYTGELLLSKENVCDVLPVASQLQLNEIVQHCEEFFVAKVSVQNCLSFLSAAEKFDLQEAIDKCNKFVLNNFHILSQTTEFKNLSQEQLCTYISDDRLKCSGGEIDVFRATLKWFEAKYQRNNTGEDSSDLADLMQHVRFPLIPTDLLLDKIQTCRHILENMVVMRIVAEALRFQSAENLYSQALKEGKQYQPRGKEKLVLVWLVTRNTGPNAIRETKMHTLELTGNEPFQTQFAEQVLPMTLYRFHPAGLSMVSKGNYLFLFGAMAVRFDVKTNNWFDLKLAPYQEFVGKAIALLENNIYLFGGMHTIRTNPNTTNQGYSACASQYSIETNSWSRLKNLPKHLAFHSAAAHGNYVFCAGGCSRQWRIQDFPEGGREPSRGGVNTPNFPENCMKSKEFGRPGGACVPHAPLDPPMHGMLISPTNFMHLML